MKDIVCNYRRKDDCNLKAWSCGRRALFDDSAVLEGLMSSLQMGAQC